MKILFFADNFPPEVNAAATRVYERALYWVQRGHEVTFITSAPNFPQGKIYPGYSNKWYQVEMIKGIRVVRVKTFIAKNSGFFLRILDFLSYMLTSFLVGICQKKHDVVCVTSPQFFAAIGAWACAKLRRTPYVFELGDLWPKSIVAVEQLKPGFVLSALEKVELFLYRQSRAVIALTESFKKDLIQRGINGDKIHVVRNGVDLSLYQPQNKDITLIKQLDLQDKKIVGYIGTHGSAQGLVNVIEAAYHLRDNADIHFIFVGAGAEKPLMKSKAKQYDLTNVTFIDPVPKDEIKKYWSILDIALIHLKNNPTFAEVIPSKIFEAMAMGRPILFAGPQGEGSQIIIESQSGIAMTSDSPEYLAQTIEKITRDSDVLQYYQTKCIDNVMHYSREVQADAMLQVLMNITELQNIRITHAS